MTKAKVKIVIKIKPRSRREINLEMKEQWQCAVRDFEFDNILNPDRKNRDAYEVIAPIIQSCKAGYNGTIFTYGQALSGKTYTMMGTEADPGIKVLAIRNLFMENNSSSTRQFLIRVGFMEILNEKIYDLLNRRQLVHFSRHNGSDVKLSNKEIIVKDVQSILQLLEKGNNQITLKSREAKERSSTIVHTVFQIIIESQERAAKNGPVRKSCLNFVDLNGSEMSHIKNEQGSFVDKSLECFGLAIDALSGGKKFQNYCKSKLTRMLKTTFNGNANTAIICNVVPTVLEETCKSLSFADKARKAKTHAVSKYAGHSIMKQLQSDLDRLSKLLKSAVTSDVSKIGCEIKKIKSILLMEKDMQHVEEPFKKILKIRPFSSESFNSSDHKYQIVEMEDVYMDSESRLQRNGVGLKISDFYLERTGFELNLKMRHYLKSGRNLVGRSDEDEDVDIHIDSLECSRKHCAITVSGDSVSLTDLNSSNGTVINGVKIKGRTIELHERDLIGIVGYKNCLKLVGNIDAIVYRLCKVTTAGEMPTFEIEDDVIIELSDDDDEGDVSYYPLKMELEESSDVRKESEIPPSDVSAVLPLQKEPSTNHNALTQPVTSPYYELAPVYETCQSVIENCDFDLSSYILENFTCDELDKMKMTSIVSDQNGNDEGQPANLIYKHILNQLKADDTSIVSAQNSNDQNQQANLTFEQDLIQLKADDEIKNKKIAELESELIKLTQQNDSLKSESEKYQTQLDEHTKRIDSLKCQLQEVEKDRNFLKEKNLQHIEELMSHFVGKKPKLN